MEADKYLQTLRKIEFGNTLVKMEIRSVAPTIANTRMQLKWKVMELYRFLNPVYYFIDGVRI